MRAFRFIVLSLLLCALAQESRAQNIYAGNPADPALLEAAFSNPALNAYVKDRLALAMTSYHVGVAGGLFAIRSGIISYHLPWQMRGIAAAVQFLKIGLYSQNEFRLSYGRRVAGPLSIGGNVDLFTRSFDRSQFYLFDDRDPVFSGGTTKVGLTVGFGLAVEPYPSLSIGLAVEHVNQPDLAMGSEIYHQPLAISLGLKWHMRGFNATSSANSLPLAHYSLNAGGDAANRFFKYAGVGAEIPVGRATVRANSDASAVQVEAEAPLFSELYINYRYAYPLTAINVASDGTHRFGFIYDFNRVPPLPAMPVLPDLPHIQTDVLPLQAPPCALYYVYADADSVNVMKLHVRRNVEPGVARRSLGLIFPEDLGNLQASRSPTPLRELNPLQVRDPLVRPHGYYTANYLGTLESIAQQLRAAKSGVKQEVISFPGTERRANALVNALTGDHLAVQRAVPIFTTSAPPLNADSADKIVSESEDVQRVIEPEHMVFHIVPVFQQSPVNHWNLEIRNAHEAGIYTFTGTGMLPDSLTWNWLDAEGKVIPPGLYFYILKVVDNTGRVTYSDRGRFEAIHQSRSLTIDVTRKSRVGEIPADKYILIVGSQRTPFESQRTDSSRAKTQ